MLDFSTTIYAGAGLESESPAPVGIAKRAGGVFVQALAGGLPGQWSSDHRKEAEFFSHWNGVAIHQICVQLMQADCAVYRDISANAKRKRRAKAYTTQDESEELPETHPLVKILKRPNDYEPGSICRYRFGQQIQSTGKAMTWNVPNVGSRLGIGFGRTVQRIIIPTSLASPVQPCREYPTGGWRIQPMSPYWGCDPQGFMDMFGGATLAMGRVIPHEQMQITAWPHPIYVDDGCSPTGRGSRWIDGETQVGIAQWSQLKNGADPSIHIEIPLDAQWDDDMADLYAKKFKDKYGGPQNTGQVLMTQGGAVKQLSMTPKDMSYTEAFIQYRDAIMALHGAVAIEADSYASFFARLKQLSMLTVQPILDLMAEADTERIAPEYGEGLTIEYTARSIDDPEVINAEITTDVAARAITKNEIRALRGRPPHPEGDVWAGQEPQQTAMNVNGALSLNGQQGSGFGLSLGSSDSTGVGGMPSLKLPAGQQDGPPPRLSLNGVGKRHNGHAKAWEGYP